MWKAQISARAREDAAANSHMNDNDNEKKTFTEQIRPVTEASAEEGSTLPHPFWAPGFVARFPWLGFGALLTVMVCAGLCVLTLVLSNGKPQTHWPSKIAPNVIIGGLNNLANIMFGIAISNGVAIAWWRQVLRGATIERLHRSWSFSSSFKDLALSGKHFNVVALAALTAKLAIVDSILLQRSTGTDPAQADPIHRKNIAAYVNDTIPITGTVTSRSAVPGLFSNNTMQNVAIWQQSGSQFANTITDCDGMCTLYMPGAGFEIACDNSTQVINYGTSSVQGLLTETKWYSSNQTGPDPNATLVFDMFSVSFSASYRTNEWAGQYSDGIDYSTISMAILYTNASDTGTADNATNSCPGTLYQRTCTLRPAVIDYPVTVHNHDGKNAANGLSLNFNSGNDLYSIGNYTTGGYDPENKQQTNYTVLRYNDVYEDFASMPEGEPSRLAGLLLAFNTYLSGNSSIYFSGTAGFTIEQQGLADTMVSSWPSSAQMCGYIYKDPTDYLVQQINRLMFIYSIDPYYVDPNNNWAQMQSFSGQWYRDTVKYTANYSYMAGAVASMFFCVLCVLPSYYGYWQLGRKVTLGPLEIANAFRSPVLESEASNGEVKDLIRAVGDRRVQYGEMITEEQAGRLAVADPEVVKRVHPSIGSARVEINERIGNARVEINERIEQVVGRNLRL